MVGTEIDVFKAVGQPTSAKLENRGPIGALVTGADYRGLGVVRSLGRHGIPVWVLKQPDHPLAAASRYSQCSLSWPAGDERSRVDFLVNLADKQGLRGWLLLPTDDEVVGLVARHHGLLAKHFLLTTPPWEELKWACDKRLLDKAAAALDIDRPWTFHPRNREDLAGLDCSFPVIIKPAIRQAPNRLTDDKAWRVDDRDSLLARYDEARSIISPDLILIQEMIPGWGEAQFSYAALCLDGRPLASVVAKRTRQFPMDFGRFSTYVETIDEPGVVEPALRLLKAFHYTGLV